MKRTSLLSIAAVVASAFALHAPIASAADNAAQSTDTKKGVPGVDVDVGKNASDKGLPGVEMNVGKDGDQKNINKDQTKKDTRTLGANSDPTMDNQDTKATRKRADRN